jgi:transposase
MSEEMSQTKRRFTKEFKEEAVRLSEQSDLPIRQVAANLGLHEKVLHRWRREMHLSRRRKTRFAPGNGNVRDEELERLKKENQQLRMEREILKKAMAFFVPRP